MGDLGGRAGWGAASVPRREAKMKEPIWRMWGWRFGRWLGDLAEPAMLYSARWWKRVLVACGGLLLFGILVERVGGAGVSTAVGMVVGLFVVCSWVGWWFRRK